MGEVRRGYIFEALMAIDAQGEPVTLAPGACAIEEFGDSGLIGIESTNAHQAVTVPLPKFEEWLSRRNVGFQSW